MDNQPYQPQYQQNNNSTIIIGSQKSAGTAVLLAFLFGPLGLFYASTTGGLVMLFGGGIFIIFTLAKSNKWIIFLSIFWAIIVCYAQLYVAVHYPFDIFCGAILK